MILAIIVISILGTLLHFAYDFFKRNKLLGVFAAVNESSWEHIKIAITPTLLYSLIDGYLYGSNPNYFLAKSVSIIVLIVVIPAIFYSYTAIAKRCILPIDITLFYIAIICSQFSFYGMLKMSPIPEPGVYFSFILFIVIFSFYLLSTFLPMKNFLFRDPLTHNYGFVDVKHFTTGHGVDSEIRAINPMVLTADADQILEGLQRQGFQNAHCLNGVFSEAGKDYMLVNVNGVRIDVLSLDVLEGKDAHSAVKIYTKDLDKTYDRLVSEHFETVVEKQIIQSSKLALLKDSHDRYVLLSEHVKK